MQSVLQPEEKPARIWDRHALRILDIIDRQVRSLRYRELITAYRSGEVEGAYWGAYTDIADYGVPTPLKCPGEKTTELAQVHTRLAAMPAETQERLINWGYAVCDAAMRAHVDPSIAAATEFPYPANPVVCTPLLEVRAREFAFESIPRRPGLSSLQISGSEFCSMKNMRRSRGCGASESGADEKSCF